jgi:hypothetical protein
VRCSPVDARFNRGHDLLSPAGNRGPERLHGPGRPKALRAGLYGPVMRQGAGVYVGRRAANGRAFTPAQIEAATASYPRRILTIRTTNQEAA